MTRMTVRTFLIAVGMLAAIPALVAFGEERPTAPEPVPNEAMLKKAGIKTDDASLLEFLRVRSVADDDLQNLSQLIEHLGAQEFQERENASARLVALGKRAIPALQKAQQQKRKGVRSRFT